MVIATSRIVRSASVCLIAFTKTLAHVCVCVFLSLSLFSDTLAYLLVHTIDEASTVLDGLVCKACLVAMQNVVVLVLLLLKLLFTDTLPMLSPPSSASLVHWRLHRSAYECPLFTV